jgi:hypothetical protein
MFRHQWFGNLVTMDWWDGLWLNEAFVTLLGEGKPVTRDLYLNLPDAQWLSMNSNHG